MVGYEFDSWTGVPVGMELDNPLVLTADGPLGIQASFIPTDISWRARVVMADMPSDWHPVQVDPDGGWLSDLSIVCPSGSGVSTFIDEIGLLSGENSLVDDGFEGQGIGDFPQSWTAQGATPGLMQVVETPTVSGLRTLRANASTSEEGAFRPGTGCDDADLRLDFSAYLPAGMSAGGRSLAVGLNGVRLEFTSRSDGGHDVVIMDSSTPDGAALGLFSLPAGTWGRCTLLLDRFVDTDHDGLDDEWEMENFGNLDQDADGDFDNDGVSNLQEFLDGTDPCHANASIAFESEESVHVEPATGQQLTVQIRLLLSQAEAVPVTAVIDIPFASATPEVDFHCISPQVVVFPPGTTTMDIEVDILGDNVVGEPEEGFRLSVVRQHGANRGSPESHLCRIVETGAEDSDDDLLPDWWEVQFFSDLNESAGGDPDNDGVSNLVEYQQGRHPNAGARSDSDNTLQLNLDLP
jgi:hypothetical protein